MIEQKTQDYLLAFCEPESDLLKKINRETYSQVLMPRMLSGHYQGRVLAFLSKMIQANRILEVGTFTGYATLCLAEGLSKEGKIISIDVNEELQERVQNYFDASTLGSKIQYILGDAQKIIPTLDESFDLVFIDADKKNNGTYFQQVIDKVRKNGIIIVDNVLWSGRIVAGDEDKDSKSIRDFNKLIQEDSRVEQLILPVRDGLLLMRKK